MRAGVEIWLWYTLTAVAFAAVIVLMLADPVHAGA